MRVANLLIVCVSSLVLAHAPAKADQFDAIRTKIKSALVEKQIPSLAVAVARDGNVIWEQGFGWADRENRIPATQHTMYSLASISKPITATGLMVLVHRGKINLDHAANRYLGQTKITSHVGSAEDATIRRLANHSSGLPLHYQFFYVDEPFRRPPRDETIRRYGHLVTAPGERYQYANLGYGILDYIIQRESGMSYAEFMRREVFLPLGLNHTSVGIGRGLKHHQAIRYSSHQEPLPFYDFDHPGASAVYSSAHDLVRFGQFHLKQLGKNQEAILLDALIDEMQRPTAETGDGRMYGVGWSINPDEDGLKTISHSGGMGGVRTRLTLVPKEKIAVVALCNFSSDLPMEITRDILCVLIPARDSKPEDKPTSTNTDSPKELLGHWVGEVVTYRGSRKIELWFKPSGDIHVQFNGQLKTLLSDSQFAAGYLKGKFAGDIQTPDANRRPYHLHLDVKHRDSLLNGSLTSISLPGQRMGNALSHSVELRKESASKSSKVETR